MIKFEELEQTGNRIVDLSFYLSLQIIEFSDELNDCKKFAIANQILRSGTSVGANVREAQQAESKSDFVHKMKIAAKELDETAYWLQLCKLSKHYPYHEEIANTVVEIRKIINAIISLSKK